jgi:hypothetical protein
MQSISEIQTLWTIAKEAFQERTQYIADYCRSHGMSNSGAFPSQLNEDSTYQELDKAAKEARDAYMHAKYPEN